MTKQSSFFYDTENRAMRVKEAAAYIGIAKSTFWAWVSQGKLPAGRKLSARTTIWRKSELDTFLENAEKNTGM